MLFIYFFSFSLQEQFVLRLLGESILLVCVHCQEGDSGVGSSSCIALSGICAGACEVLMKTPSVMDRMGSLQRF